MQQHLYFNIPRTALLLVTYTKFVRKKCELLAFSTPNHKTDNDANLSECKFITKNKKNKLIENTINKNRLKRLQ